jgi:flavin-dependent dehydrogenase
VDDSTGEGIYYADATGASAAQATYVEVGGRPAEAAGMYAELARPYVEEVKRSRMMSRLLERFGKVYRLGREVEEALKKHKMTLSELFDSGMLEPIK